MGKSLTKQEKCLIKTYIDSNPIKTVESFDLQENRILYNNKIGGWNISQLKDEEIVRAYLLSKLCNELGYEIENLEIEHEYKSGRPHTNTSRIDIIVRDKKGDAFLFVELKSPDAYFEENREQIIEEQLFKVAIMEEAEKRKVKYLMLYTINIINTTINDECIIIDFTKFHTYKDWEVTRDYVNTIPFKYGKAQKTPYIKGSPKDLVTHFTNELLNGLQKELHNVL